MSKSLAVPVIILFLVGCEPPKQRAIRDFEALERAQIDDIAGNNAARRDGEEAFAAGVPADANPFQGAPGFTFKSRSWLAGWIDASEKAKQATNHEAGR